MTINEKRSTDLYLQIGKLIEESHIGELEAHRVLDCVKQSTYEANGKNDKLMTFRPVFAVIK